MRKSDINSSEIAKLAGVSRSTVSRVINNYPNVPKKTQEKIMNIIQRYNYFPNMSGQVLAGKKTKTIGLFMVGSAHVSSDILTNLLIVSVIEKASALGYYVLTHLISNSQDIDIVKSVKEIFFQRRIDGGIFIGAANHEPLIEELIAEGFMVAIVDQDLPGRHEPNRIVVNFDNDNGMMVAVEYLAKLNHRKIGVITGDMKRNSGPAKYEGFIKAMKNMGLTVYPKWVIPGSFNENAGYEAIHTFFKKGLELPTAIIAANDSVAFGAIRAFNERGIRIPEDISLIGFDDHILSANYIPPLTTIKTDFTEMMEKLTSALVFNIEQETSGFCKYVMGSTLVIRNSCKEI